MSRLTKLVNKFYAPLVLLVLGLSLFLRLNNLDQPNSFIFDEDMHAYTASLMAENDPKAYEWWHSSFEDEFEDNFALYYRPPAVEWLHPPVSKLLQASSIKLFGLNAFAWRLPSALTGIGIVILVLLITLQLTKNKVLALLAGLLACFEPLLLVQSRIASADIFLAFFSLLTVYFYLKYFITKSRLTSWKPYILLGISLGLTLATKWSGAFLVLGLLGFETWEVVKSKKTSIIKGRLWRWAKILLVAFLIYLLSFTQMFLQGKDLSHFTSLHRQAYWYQTHTSFTHPHQSRPLQWLVGQKPVWYYYHQDTNGKVSEIIAKPWTWLTVGGFLSLIYLNLQLARKKLKLNKKQKQVTAFLTFITLGMYLPWFFIGRTLFIYQMTSIISVLIIIVTLLISIIRNFISPPKTSAP